MWQHLTRRISRVLGSGAALLPTAATAPRLTPTSLELDPKQWIKRATRTHGPRLGAATADPWRARLGAAAADLRRPPSGLAFVRSFGTVPVPYIAPNSYYDSQDCYHPYDYVERCKPLIKIPNASVRVLGVTDENYFYVTDEAAGLFQSLSHMLWRLNSKGASFAHPLTVSDLHVVNAIPHYQNAGPHDFLIKRFPIFIPRKNLRYLAASTESINRDHYYASLAMMDMLVHCYGEDILNHIMDDLKDYFTCMKDPSLPKGYPTLVHPALLQLEFRSEAFLDIYDLIEARTLPRDLLYDLLDDMPYQEEWAEIATKNLLLKKWYEFPDEGYETEKPLHLLKFLRSVYRHSCDYQYKTDVRGYSKRELFRLLHVKFPLILPNLYKKLWDNKRLLKLRPHRFFLAPY